MPKKNVIIIAVVAVCLLLGIYLFWDYQQKKQAALEKKIRQETLIIAFGDMPTTLNPLYEQNATGLTLLDPIFDGLANRSGRQVRHYENGLATDFIQDEQKHNIFIIELDEEKRWHDDPNHMVTARDVRFTVECIKNEKNKSPLRGRLNQLIERVDIIDNFKLRVVFKENISIHVVRDLMAFKIIPTTYYGKPLSLDLRTDEVAQEFASKPIGTGKYVFKEWQGNTITLAAFKSAKTEGEANEEGENVKKEIKIQNIEAILIHDQEKQARMLIDGKVDLVLETSPKLHEMMNEKGLKHSDYVPLHFYGIAFNTISPNFTNNIVRQAIARAINRTELAQQVRSGDVAWLINKGPFPHNDDKRYDKLVDYLSFDLQQAKKLINKKGGFKTTLIYQDDASKTQERLASKIVLMLNEIGIIVEPKSL
ncbi:ABC transporter substrate-binding protein, partial [bacterium]|nr:ABC transporter substrate-binding protein [bacterium]